MGEEVDSAVFEAVVAGLGCGALVVDNIGTVRCANARLGMMVATPSHALAGTSVERLLESSGEWLAGGDVASERESRLLRAGQAPLPVLVLWGARVRAPGGADRLLLVIDISAQKEAEARQQSHLAEVSRLGDTVIEQAIALKRHAEQLEERVRERTAELHEANLDSIFMLAVASEAKDADTGAHVLRIQRGAEGVARRMGLGKRVAEEIGYSSILHDVGKMVVPDQILQKPAALTADERAVIEQHTLAGERILSRKPFFAVARQIARGHHENWDGSGYPDGLAGEAIPRAARIVHVVDVFDALTSARVYKPAWPLEKAIAFLDEQQGRMFDTEIVTAFLGFLHDGDAIASGA